MSNLVLGAGGAAADAYTIDQSLRFNAADSPYLTRTYTGADAQKATWSFWFKRSTLSANQMLWWFGSNTSGGDRCFCYLKSGNKINFFFRAAGGSGTSGELETNRLIRDPSAWYHFVVAVDTTQATGSDRIQMYLNGVDLRSTGEIGVSSDPAEDAYLGFNTSPAVMHINERGDAAYDEPLGGYIAEFYFIQGTQYAASDFGETDEDTNQWKPIDASGLTFGTNGFYQKYGSATGHTSFTSAGSTTWTAPEGVTSVDYLVVGGGGGGGGDRSSGGGGAGGFRTGTLTVVGGTSYTVTVGAGGAGGSASNGTSGSDSVFSTITSTGGGYGTTSSSDGGSGGSGGGGGNDATNDNGGSGNTPVTSPSQGNDGGYGNDAPGSVEAGGGGGGAGAVGGNASGTTSGNGGSGTANSITGSSVTYAGGGGGSSHGGTDGSGGSGGGGAAGSNGTANTGGGGGAALSSPGGDGGSGIVIVKAVAGQGFGLDSSGNGNNFTATNLVASDKMVDSPTNNFATMVGPLVYNSVGNTYSEGNLKVAGNSTDSMAVFGTIYPPETGKWYFEAFCTGTTDGSYPVIGVADYGYAYANFTNWSGSGFGGTLSSNNAGGQVLANGGQVAEPNWVQNDIVGIAIDNDNGAVYWSKNGTWYDGTSGHGSSDPESGGSKTGASKTWTAGAERYGPAVNVYATAKTVVFNFGSDSSFAGATSSGGNSDTNSIGDFKYAVPSGYSSICTSNLPDPEIKLPADNFNTVLYSGNSSDDHNISVGFKPDFVWIKDRNVGPSAHYLVDAVRGLGSGDSMKVLATNSSDAQYTNMDDQLISFDTDGFTLDDNTDTNFYVNITGENYAAWNWLGANGTVTNTDGTNIDSTVSANQDAGFSICKYTATNTIGDSFGHGLAQKPDLLIFKNLDRAFGASAIANWTTFSDQLTTDYTTALALNETAAVTSYNGLNQKAPTASVVELGDNDGTNYGTDDYICYCFHSVEGYSKVGTYEGNGNADGAFIYTGFSPAMVIIKNIDDAQDWSIIDNKRPGYNEVDEILSPNLSNTEDAGTSLDFTSNGFKCRNGSDINNSSKTMLYIAFAESPFKYANAR